RRVRGRARARRRRLALRSAAARDGDRHREDDQRRGEHRPWGRPRSDPALVSHGGHASTRTGGRQRPPRNRKGSRWSSYLDSDCLFPREQEATGMNSTVLTASLTGRIQFFYCVALLRTLLT